MAAEISGYEVLEQQLRKSPGVTDFVVQAIQNGLELEVFRGTKPGKLLIGRAVQGMINHLELVLDPNLSGEKLLQAVAELRVMHRMLVFIEETIAGGTAETTKLSQDEDAPL